MKIASWNISTGRRANSKIQFDYETRPNLAYFADHLRAINPDVVCLQETERNDADSMAHTLAEMIGSTYAFETAMSESHISDSQICIAILSKRPFLSTVAHRLPYPRFDLFLPNGQPARRFEKYVQVVTIGSLTIGNTFHHPLELLGHPYTDEVGQEYTDELCDFYTRTLTKPLILAGDFSTPQPTRTFAKALDALDIVDATPPVTTKPGIEGHLDAIFADKTYEVLGSAIVPTENDHYLAWAELDIAY